MGNRLYVGNLPYSADENAVRELFSQNDRSVVEVTLVTDRDTGRPRGFGFVEMSSLEDSRRGGRGAADFAAASGPVRRSGARVHGGALEYHEPDSVIPEQAARPAIDDSPGAHDSPPAQGARTERGGRRIGCVPSTLGRSGARGFRQPARAAQRAWAPDRAGIGSASFQIPSSKRREVTTRSG